MIPCHVTFRPCDCIGRCQVLDRDESPASPPASWDRLHFDSTADPALSEGEHRD